MWDILGIKGLILGFLVFAPLERLIAMHKGQKILRPAWKLDLFYALFSSLITKAGLIAIVAGMSLLASRWMRAPFMHGWGRNRFGYKFRLQS